MVTVEFETADGADEIEADDDGIDYDQDTDSWVVTPGESEDRGQTVSIPRERVIRIEFEAVEYREGLPWR
jgi:hypothetical protein